MVCSFYDNDYICDLSVYISGLLCLWSVVLVILVCGFYVHVCVMFMVCGVCGVSW